jgi:hypothetical protein
MRLEKGRFFLKNESVFQNGIKVVEKAVARGCN